MIPKSGIYKILNSINNKIYVGSAVVLEKRWLIHKNFLDNNKHPNIHLQRSVLKYGPEAFQFIILEIVEDKTKLIEREQYWIDKLNPEYNILKIAGSLLGYKHSEETKLKYKNRNTIEANEKRSISQTGVVKSEEHKAKIGISNFKPNKWPHADGNKCKCRECKDLRNQMNRNAPSYPWGKFRHV